MLALLLLAIPFANETAARPNILLAIADDQSFPHASAYGHPGLHTPGFDSVAADGVLFTNCYAASPGCAPSRAGLLTGRHPWMLEEAGTHASRFPAKWPTYPDLLAAAGYHVGYTGKGWGPGNYKAGGRTSNPAGPGYSKRTLTPPNRGISRNDYAANFRDFLEARDDDEPFCFWFGATEPHRVYDAGEIGRASCRERLVWCRSRWSPYH